MRARIAPLLALVLIASGGCMESTLVRTSPPDAKVYAGDRFVGVTPTVFSIPVSEVKDGIMLRIERDGYASQEVAVPTHIAPGRIVGGIFSLGISWLFKSPTTLVDRVDVDLRPLPNSTPRTAPSPESTKAAAAPQEPATAPNPKPASAISGSAEGRLKKLDDLFSRGLITEQEYRRYRAEILNDL